MHKLALVFTVVAALGLSACGDKADETAKPVETAITVPVGNDKAEWGKYMNAVVKPHFKQGVTQRVWPYLVMPGETDENARKLTTLQEMAYNGLVAGQLLVYVGPDSALTADLVVEGLKEAKAGSLERSELLFVGKRADEERVKTVVAASGLTFLFQAMD